MDPVWAMGQRLRDGFDAAAERHGLEARAFGLPPAVRFRFSEDPETHNLANITFQRALLERGIFAPDVYLLSYAHQPADIDETLDAMNDALAAVASSMHAAL